MMKQIAGQLILLRRGREAVSKLRIVQLDVAAIC